MTLTNQSNGLPIERGKRLPAQLFPLIGYDAIGKIPARLKHRKPCLYGGPVNRNVLGLNQPSEGTRDDTRWNSVATGENPNQFAQGR